MANSTKRRKRKTAKPKKPYKDFPLFPHANGRWCKKIRGRHFYFGRWDNGDDPQAALDKYLDQKDDLQAGRVPRARRGDVLTVRDLCNRYLTAKKHLLDTGELAECTFRDYFSTCENLVRVIGKDRPVDDLVADDFESLRESLAKTRGLVSLGVEITHIRGVFKFAYDQGLIERPVRYGQSFRKPSAKAMRLVRAKNGRRDFQRQDLLTILNAAGQPMKAMVLLGINAGLGNSDVARFTLETARAGIATGWIDYPRGKTGIERRIPLWAETRDAMQEAIGTRPTPKDAADADLAFLTPRALAYVRGTDDSLGRVFAMILRQLGLYRPGVGFYSLRRTFQTVADASRDPVAVAAIMGHSDSSMGAVYRQGIDDYRLEAVTNVVRDWVFGV